VAFGRASYAIADRVANKRRGAGPCGLLAAVLLLAASAPPQVVIHTGSGREVTVDVEVAATPAGRARGLMFRRELAPMHGMLFVFPEEADHAFWMKNTQVSLDIIFIDTGHRVVGIETNTMPYSERRLRAGRRSRYVLEVPAGSCASQGIEVGDSLEFRGIDAAAEAGDGR